MKTYKRFRDIPQFVKSGSWECDFNLKELVVFINEQIKYGLQLNPNFQRGHIWTEEQQIAFIEFYLRGGKSSRIIYLNCPSWNYDVEEGEYNEFVCVDGLQRITAIQRFINNEIPAFGTLFKDYEDKMSLSWNSIKVNVNDLQTEEDVLRWYIDMNIGGTPHSKEEIARVQRMLADMKSEK